MRQAAIRWWRRPKAWKGKFASRTRVSKFGLKTRTLADNGVDRLEVHQLLVAQKSGAFAQRPVEREADGLDAARAAARAWDDQMPPRRWTMESVSVVG